MSVVKSSLETCKLLSQLFYRELSLQGFFLLCQTTRLFRVFISNMNRLRIPRVNILRRYGRKFAGEKEEERSMEIDGFLEGLNLICFSATSMGEDCPAGGRCVGSKVGS